ncbi:MAG: endonuclease domain-containing protein [Sphingomonas bacterium]|nr:endonuclease domain-containing protein [Sphingomonas bacterium]
MPRIVDRNILLARARMMRRTPTLPEGLLWQHLRARPNGLKFRRQHPIGSYIADFYCAAAKLVIEVDGVSHTMAARVANDQRRDQWLAEQGIHVVRFAAVDVLKDVVIVREAVIRAARRRLPLHHAAHGPPPQDAVLGRK